MKNPVNWTSATPLRLMMNYPCPESMVNDESRPERVKEVAVKCPNCKGKAAIYVSYLFEETESTISCKQCAHRKLHTINWPTDAYYRVETCGAVLWAWSREHLVEIRDYVASEDRGKRKYPHFFFKRVRRIPAQFLDVKRRAAVVRAIDRVLAKA